MTKPNNAAIEAAWTKFWQGIEYLAQAERDKTLPETEIKAVSQIAYKGGYKDGHRAGYESAKAAESADTTRDALVKAREALIWYRAMAGNCRKIHQEGDDARHSLDLDGGNRARLALEAIEAAIAEEGKDV